MRNAAAQQFAARPQHGIDQRTVDVRSDHNFERGLLSFLVGIESEECDRALFGRAACGGVDGEAVGMHRQRLLRHVGDVTRSDAEFELNRLTGRNDRKFEFRDTRPFDVNRLRFGGCLVADLRLQSDFDLAFAFQ